MWFGDVADFDTVVERAEVLAATVGLARCSIGADELAATLQAGDVTLLNVKTPYIGEIEGTDLYIPYTDLAARAAYASGRYKDAIGSYEQAVSVNDRRTWRSW